MSTLSKAPPNMAGAKRKIEEHRCDCFDDSKHATKGECEASAVNGREENIIRHLILDSSVVTIFVGEGKGKKAFVVHKDLLMLYSEFFNKQLAGEDDNKVELYFATGPLRRPTPTQFAHFINWLYTGWYEIDRADGKYKLEDDLEGLWVLGHVLESPSFQNCILQNLINAVKTTVSDGIESSWPDVGEAMFIYKYTKDGSELRKFASNTLVFRNPFQRHEVGSQLYTDWEALLRQVPHGTDLSLDLHRASGKKWNSTKPWDDEHRSSYTIAEVPIDERWEQLILNKHSKEVIQKAADGGCISSKFELAHLSRKKD